MTTDTDSCFLEVSRSFLSFSRKWLSNTCLITIVSIACVCVHAQSCPTLCEPMGCSPPCSCVHGIFLAGLLECITIASSRGSPQTRDPNHISCISCTGRKIHYMESPGKPQFKLVIILSKINIPNKAKTKQ